MGLLSFLNKQGGDSVGQLMEGTSKILDGLITNKEEKAKVFVELSKMQVEVNKLEASSSSNFKGGWRPAIGGVCAIALGYNFVVRDWINYYVSIAHEGVELAPALQMEHIMTLTLGMLGMGAFRSVDKIMNKSK